MNCLPGSWHTPFHTSPCTCLAEFYPLDPGTVSFYVASARSKIDCHTAIVTANQREQAGIKNGLATNVAVALEFERSNWVNGLVTYDEFYCVPLDMADAPAGALLKLQKNANTSAYTVPPNTAISRFMFQTKTLNGSTVPGSAYILCLKLNLMEVDILWLAGPTEQVEASVIALHPIYETYGINLLPGAARLRCGGSGLSLMKMPISCRPESCERSILFGASGAIGFQSLIKAVCNHGGRRCSMGGGSKTVLTVIWDQLRAPQLQTWWIRWVLKLIVHLSIQPQH